MASTNMYTKDKHGRIMAADSWVTRVETDAEKELIKAEFNDLLHAHFLSTRSLEDCSKMTNLWSYNCLDPLILRIQKEKEKSGQDGIYVYNHEDKFMMVGIWKGKERLFFKDENGQFKVILPWEDIFDIFWETHIKYCHPNSGWLKNILQDEYIVNDFAIQKISEVCYKCSEGQKPYLRCALDIMSLYEIADFAFTQIMICQDMYTGYIHLRPLSIDSKESEICLELLRIFMDFGPPKQVLISNNIFRTALDQIKHLTTYAPISIEVFNVKERLTKFKLIRKTITQWMKNNEFENWSIACYGVQSYLNNRTKGQGEKSPYDMVFKKIQSCVVKDLNEVEFDSFELASSSDVKIDKGVFTTFSPADFNVASNASDAGRPDSSRSNAEQASSSLSSPVEEQLIDDEILAGSGHSDDELIQADEEDPLAIDWAIGL